MENRWAIHRGCDRGRTISIAVQLRQTLVNSPPPLDVLKLRFRWGAVYSVSLYQSLFGSKLGFSRILDSHYGAYWRCSPKVNRFGWNLSALWGRSWQIAVATVRGSRIFCPVNNARFHRFSVRQISRNLNTIRRSVSQWKFSEQNFENIIVRVRFSEKRKIFSKSFQRLATLGRHNSAMTADRRKFTTGWLLYGIIICIFPLESNQSHSSGL